MKKKKGGDLTYGQVKSLVNIETVARRLGIQLKKRGREFVASCPLPGHSEKTASFTIGGKRENHYFCFGCGGGGDLFDLVGACLSLTKAEAFKWIIEEFASTFPDAEMSISTHQQSYKSINRFRNTSEQITNQPDIETSSSFWNENLYDEVYSALLEALPKQGWGLAEIKKRNLPVGRFIEAKYRSLPFELKFRTELAEILARTFKLSEKRRVPGIFRKSDGKWCFGGNQRGSRHFRCTFGKYSLSLDIPALIFPLRSVNGKIYGLKLRNPDFPLSKVGLTASQIAEWKKSSASDYTSLQETVKYYPPKYQVVSTANRNFGCGLELRTHYSVLSQFSKDRFILTEGELKADSIASLTTAATAALAGVNLHQDKFLEDIYQCRMPNWAANVELPDSEIKSFDELSALTNNWYAGSDLPQLFGKTSRKIILIAFDRDDSAAVTKSLLKLRIYSELLGSRLEHKLFYMFWKSDGGRAKGFDDLLTQGGKFTFLPLHRIWKD